MTQEKSRACGEKNRKPAEKKHQDKSKDLSDLVIESGARSLAVIGTAKNVGKTVTMNYLVSELSSRGMTLGLISSGRDGEIIDVLTGEPKPSVTPPAGTWIATAEGVLGEAAMNIEIADVFERTGIFGRIIIGRMVESVPIELVGPPTAKELSLIVKNLLAFGADIVLVDGALDRKSAASPQVTDAAILSTGAVAGRNIRAIAEEMGFWVWLLSRPQHDDEKIRALARKAVEKETVCLIRRSADGFTLDPIPYVTVLGNEDDILELADDAVAVVVPGAVTQEFVEAVWSWVEDEEFCVIARDAVSIFVDKMPGISLYVVYPMRVLAATVNPSSFADVQHDSEELVREIAEEISRWGHPLPVFDVVSGEKSFKGVSGLVMG
ncbi:MAG TPA: hypothetical protein PLK53_05625 [Bacillota bacterium]|nr:hypothetical protein [Bacillota bacterium]